MRDCTTSFSSRRHTFLVVLTACALTTAVVGLAATLALTSYRAALEGARQNAHFISSLVANQMSMALVDIEGTLKEMALHLQERGDDSHAASEPQLYELFDSIRLGEVTLKGLQLTDGEGRIEVASGMTDVEAINIDDIRKRLQNRDMLLSPPVRNPSRPGDWIFAVSKRVPRVHGELDHFVTTVVDLEMLHESFEELEMPYGTRIVVSDPAGMVYLAGPGLDGVVGSTVPEFGLPGGDVDPGAMPRLDDGDLITGRSGIARFPLQVFASFPRDEVLKPWRRHALTYGGISLALVLVSVGLSVALVRSQMQLNCQSRALALAAATDTLTGVLNRRSFLEAARREFSRAKRHGGALSCVMVDLDHFKKVNDTYGHIVGDMVLSSVARLVTSRLREADLFCRYGGEEFVLLLPDTDRTGAETLAEALRSSLSGLRLELESACLFVTASFGVADILPDTQTFDDLLVRADQALYLAKTQGRNQVRQAPLRPSVA